MLGILKMIHPVNQDVTFKSLLQISDAFSDFLVLPISSNVLQGFSNEPGIKEPIRTDIIKFTKPIIFHWPQFCSKETTMSIETIYNKQRIPIAKKSTEGKYTYLKECNGKLIAVYDSYCDKTFDSGRKFIGNGDQLSRFLPAG